MSELPNKDNYGLNESRGIGTQTQWRRKSGMARETGVADYVTTLEELFWRALSISIVFVDAGCSVLDIVT